MPLTSGLWFCILPHCKKFIFAFVGLAFLDMPWKKLLSLSSKKLFPLLSWQRFRRIVVSHFFPVASHFNDFDFIFLFGIREWSSLILLQELFNFLHTNCFWDCYSFPGDILSYFVEDFDHIFGGPFPGSISCSIDLCVCFCARTTVP